MYIKSVKNMDNAVMHNACWYKIQCKKLPDKYFYFFKNVLNFQISKKYIPNKLKHRSKIRLFLYVRLFFPFTQTHQWRRLKKSRFKFVSIFLFTLYGLFRFRQSTENKKLNETKN